MLRKDHGLRSRTRDTRNIPSQVEKDKKMIGVDLGSEPASPNSFASAGLLAQLGPYLHSRNPKLDGP